MAEKTRNQSIRRTLSMKKSEALLMLDTLAHDQTYGCFSRQGLELVAWPQIAKQARWVIFADIDGMHELNTMHGYSEVDKRIRKALNARAGDVAAIGRWYSGDEILWVISRGDPEGMVKRLTAAFAKQGLSATFAIEPVTSKKLALNVNKAAARVQQAKKNNQRGAV